MKPTAWRMKARTYTHSIGYHFTEVIEDRPPPKDAWVKGCVKDVEPLYTRDQVRQIIQRINKCEDVQ